MAKLPFSKLGIKMVNDVQIVEWEDYSFEVIQYLPFTKKLEMISNIVNLSIDDNGYYNPMRVKFFTTLETLYAYTNLTFTEKMKEDAFKLYDIVVSSGLFDAVVNALPEKEWKDIQENVQLTITNIYTYRNSAMGILETISTDYSNLDLDATNIQSKLSDPDNLALLKDVITKMA